jgi:leucyl aminopeptidase (aminopeptidase T)
MDTEAFWAGREQELEEYARLALRVGLNLQRGQGLSLLSYVEHAPLVCAIARVAYGEGARRVEPLYVDLPVRGRLRRTHPRRPSAGLRRGCCSGSRRRRSAGRP